MDDERIINILYAMCILDMNAEPVIRDMVEYSTGMTREDFMCEHLPNTEYMEELMNDYERMVERRE